AKRQLVPCGLVVFARLFDPFEPFLRALHSRCQVVDELLLLRRVRGLCGLFLFVSALARNFLLEPFGGLVFHLFSAIAFEEVRHSLVARFVSLFAMNRNTTARGNLWTLTGHRLGSRTAGFSLESVAWITHLNALTHASSRNGPLPLLDDVSQLMGQQAFA